MIKSTIKSQKTLIFSLITGCLLTISQASAAAFQLAETSSEGLGRAYAGNAAIANNASVISSNPALMTNFKRPEFSIGFIYVKPDVNLTGTVNVLGNDTDVSHKDIAPSALVPNLYFVYPFSEKTAVGAGIYVNYGLKTEFNDNYNASNIGGKTDLTTINYNLSLAQKITDKLSLGLGINAVYAKAKIWRGFGLINAKISGGQNSDTLAKLIGSAWGVGYNLGLAYQFNENHRLGIAYYSGVDIDFDGKFKSDLPLPFGTSGKEVDGSLTLKLPATYEISSSHRFGEKTVLSLSYKFTRWDKFKQLRATNKNGKELFKKAENFGNSHRYAVGLSHDFTNKLTLRMGYAYDTTPVSGDNFTISIPDVDRQWFTLGATYKFTPNLSLDAGFAYLYAKDHTFVEKEKNAAATYDSYRFTSKSSASLYGLNLNYKF